MKKYEIIEFANKIRSMYPGSYDDLSDDKLVELWTKKFSNEKPYLANNTINEGSNNKSNNNLQFVYKVQQLISLIFILATLTLLIQPNLFFNLHIGKTEFNELEGYIYHKLNQTGLIIFVILLLLCFYILIINIKNRNFLTSLILLLNGIYIVLILSNPPLSRSFFNFIDTSDNFTINKENLFYSIFLILFNMFLIIKLRNLKQNKPKFL